MSFVDIFIGGITLLFIVTSYRKGLTGEIFSLLAIVFGLYTAYLFYPKGHHYLKQYIESEKFAQVLSFAIIFFVVSFLVKLLGKLFKKLFNQFHLSWLNGILGGMVGLAKSFILIGVILSLLVHLKFPVTDKHLEKSKVKRPLLKYFNQVVKKATEAIPSNFKQQGKDIANKLNSIKK